MHNRAVVADEARRRARLLANEKAASARAVIHRPHRRGAEIEARIEASVRRLEKKNVVYSASRAIGERNSINRQRLRRRRNPS